MENFEIDIFQFLKDPNANLLDIRTSVEETNPNTNNQISGIERLFLDKNLGNDATLFENTKKSKRIQRKLKKENETGNEFCYFGNMLVDKSSKDYTKKRYLNNENVKKTRDKQKEKCLKRDAKIERLEVEKPKLENLSKNLKERLSFLQCKLQK